MGSAFSILERTAAEDAVLENVYIDAILQNPQPDIQEQSIASRLPPEILALILDQVRLNNADLLEEILDSLDPETQTVTKDPKALFLEKGYTSYSTLASWALVCRSWTYETRRAAFQEVNIIDSSRYLSWLKVEVLAMTTPYGTPTKFLQVLQAPWGMRHFVTSLSIGLCSTSPETHKTLAESLALLNSLRTVTFSIGQKLIRKWDTTLHASIQQILTSVGQSNLAELEIDVDCDIDYELLKTGSGEYPFTLNFFPFHRWKSSLNFLEFKAPALQGIILPSFAFSALHSLDLQINEQLLEHGSVEERSLMSLFDACRDTIQSLRCDFHCAPQVPARTFNFPNLKSLALNLHFSCHTLVPHEDRYVLNEFGDPNHRRPIHAIIAGCPSLVVLDLDGDGYDSGLFDFLPTTLETLTVDLTFSHLDEAVEKQPKTSGITHEFVRFKLWEKSNLKRLKCLNQLHIIVDSKSPEDWNSLWVGVANMSKPKEDWKVIWQDFEQDMAAED